MTKRAGSRPPRVNLASPVAQPPRWRHSARIVGPPARWCRRTPARRPPLRSPGAARSRVSTAARARQSSSCALPRRALQAPDASSRGGDRMEKVVEAEPRAVVFVCDREGAALGRRERCLKLAGIAYEIEAERRPSGTYYKLGVRERDAVAAHLALQMGGCGRSSRLRQSQSGVAASLREMTRTLWDEALLLLERLVDLVWKTAPRLLTGPAGAASRAIR